MRLLAVTGSETEQDLPFAGLAQLLRLSAHDLGRLPAPQADAIGVALALRSGPKPRPVRRRCRTADACSRSRRGGAALPRRRRRALARPALPGCPALRRPPPAGRPDRAGDRGVAPASRAGWPIRGCRSCALSGLDGAATAELIHAELGRTRRAPGRPGPRPVASATHWPCVSWSPIPAPSTARPAGAVQIAARVPEPGATPGVQPSSPGCPAGGSVRGRRRRGPGRGRPGLPGAGRCRVGPRGGRGGRSGDGRSRRVRFPASADALGALRHGPAGRRRRLHARGRRRLGDTRRRPAILAPQRGGPRPGRGDSAGAGGRRLARGRPGRATPWPPRRRSGPPPSRRQSRTRRAACSPPGPGPGVPVTVRGLGAAGAGRRAGPAAEVRTRAEHLLGVIAARSGSVDEARDALLGPPPDPREPIDVLASLAEAVNACYYLGDAATAVAAADRIEACSTPARPRSTPSSGPGADRRRDAPGCSPGRTAAASSVQGLRALAVADAAQ